MTELDMEGWNDKDSKKPECRKLYEEHDFITAYGLHSDLRVERDGFKGAIGRADEWETHGELQLDFLRRQGLKPSDRLLDLGCGCGRLARRAVPYLDHGRYFGLDISHALIAQADVLSREEGWSLKDPHIICGDGTLDAVKVYGRFEFVWAHSVFTHSPPEVIETILRDLAGLDFGTFLFTYKHQDAPRRSGLKQFQYPSSWFIDAASRAGLQAKALPERWPAGQRTMEVLRP